MKKLLMTLILAAMLTMPVLALCEGPVLLVELPETAQMIENVEFEDGDFIQTYQFSGAQVQLLRYASFDMSIEELAMSDWAGAQSMERMEMTRVGNFPASGVRLVHVDQESVEVTLVLVDAGAYTLMYSAVVPLEAEDAVRAQVAAMVESMQVHSQGAEESLADVG